MHVYVCVCVRARASTRACVRANVCCACERVWKGVYGLWTGSIDQSATALLQLSLLGNEAVLSAVHA